MVAELGLIEGRKVVAYLNPKPGGHTHAFMCPGCGYAHCFNATSVGYNKNWHKPTLAKNIKIAGHIALFRCESKITEGVIQFSNKCTHACAGEQMELPVFNE